MIPDAFKNAFLPRIRARGDDYFAEGRVQIVQSDAVSLAAVVRGTERWPVYISASPGAVSMTCACPNSQRERTCKHLWATIRAADEAGTLDPMLETVGDFDLAMLPGSSDLIDIDPSLLRKSYTPQRAMPPVAPTWKQALERTRQLATYQPGSAPRPAWPANQRLVYIVDLPASTSSVAGLAVELATDELGRDGTFDPPKPFRLGIETWLACPEPDDRLIAQMLLGARSYAAPWMDRPGNMLGFVLTPAAFDTTLRSMCATGRCRLRRVGRERPVDPIRWDGDIPWELGLVVTKREEQPGYLLSAILRRSGDEMRLDETEILHNSGILVARETFGRFHYEGPFQLIVELRAAPMVVETDEELPALLGALFALPRIPPLALPASAHVEEASPVPTPRLSIVNSEGRVWGRAACELTLSFDYGGGLTIARAHGRSAVFHADTLRLVRRDMAAETRAYDRLLELGAREERAWNQSEPVLGLAAQRLDRAVRELIDEGWRLDVDGMVYRPITDMQTSVSSGVDWFDVHGVATFGDRQVALPRLLEAIKRGDESLMLDDGSHGLLTAEWVRRLAPLLAAGTLVGDGARFYRSQTGLLDALLATLPDVDVDATFETARAELRAFDQVAPADAPPTFIGELRPYQREGLGWLHFLRRFRLGGCLADDMGLGKTVQVLALLDARRAEGAGPSLVVVPRSLVFNWHQEAARFAPALRVLDYTGIQRRQTALDPASADLIITTYGLLRRDAIHLREIEFDYAILDEAQAIKNATTAASKAARLLRARHRLALSGTPIENRISELWSLMEFLNPGMLGSSSGFATLVRGGVVPSRNGGQSDAGGRELLARALRPVMLRRTKAQVAGDLPDRVEQTLIVELEPAQRRLYDELLAHYRSELLPHVDRVGMGRAKMQVLEALLRLRQAACHPGLLDPKRAGDESAKLDVLGPKLAEARAEGHKTLVFSQFTSFLALLRTRLDAEGVTYAYLDGKTRDRQEQVARFQTDDECRLFLISLKAGGHGLNLTAADYVFLLDPWWNPAVEAQAIDRAHRIGQTRHVIATRLVARATIEEKILELQQSKRELADAILGADAGLIAKIGREELGLLLA